MTDELAAYITNITARVTMDAEDASLSSSSMLVSFHLVSRSHRHLSCRSSSPSISEKGGKLAFGASLFGWIGSTFLSFDKNQHFSTRKQKEEISDEKGKEIFFDLKTVVFNFFFFLCFFMQAGDVMGGRLSIDKFQRARRA
jgi:hypothetical protein